MEELKEGLKTLKEMEPTRGPIDSTKMDIGEFSETEPATENHTVLELDTPLPTHMYKTWFFVSM